MEASHQELQRPVFQLTPVVQWIAAVWLSMALLQATVVTHADMLGWLGLNATAHGRAWWTLVTYSFVNVNTAQLLLGLFVLLTFGPRAELAMGTRHFGLLVLWCVLGGALIDLVFAQPGILEGSAAALFGIMAAGYGFNPKDEIMLLGVMRVRGSLAVVILSGAIGVASYTDAMPWNGMITVGGGFLSAVLYFRLPRRTAFNTLKQHMSPAPDPTDDAPHAIPHSIPRTRHAEDEDVDEIVAQSNAVVTRHPSPSAQPAQQQSRQTALDRVLDKISEQGLNALTAEDRTLLEEISRRLRDQ